jgi:lipopolysaccharide export system protein LptA
MTADQNTSLVTFSGRVIARQGDLIITCDQMKVRYQAAGAPTPPDGLEPGAGAAAASIPPPPPQEPGRVTAVDSPAEPEAPQARAGDPLGGGQEIYRVDCEGSVRVQQGDKLAVGQKALYLAKSQPRRLILTGEARIWEGANSVTGHQVVYYLDQNRSQVESRDKQRVRAFYDQGGGEQGGSGPGGGRK